MPVTRRAFSLLTVKSVSDDKRIIRGVATTPTMDRMGDIVEPLGITFKNPLPLLWQHDHRKPIGTVKFDQPTEDGITFEAEIPVISEPGTLKDRVDEAWQSIQLGLVRAVSIGFRAIEYAWMDAGGVHFIKSEVYELSAVTIPANEEAVITDLKNMDAKAIAILKSFDKGAPAATGRMDRLAKTAAGAAATSVNLTQKGKAMTLAEQIAALEASRAAKAAQMATVMQKSMDEGRSTDAAEQEEFDTLKAEVDAIDADLKRLKALEKVQGATAKPVTGVKDSLGGTALRSGVSLKANEPDKGIRFARYAKCLALSTKTHQPVVAIAENLYGKTDPDFVDITKAAVSAMTSANTSALIGNEGGFADFVEFLRPQTILGKFGAGIIPALTQIPFRVPLISETSETEAAWVGEGKAKPLTKFTVGREELAPLKIATIAVQTMELIRDSSPSSDVLVRNSLAKAIAKRSDLSFIDPTSAAVSGVRPASILNGVAAIANSTATGADGVREDVQKIIGAFVTANNPLTSGVWIMGGIYALRLMTMMNPLGQREFPGITMQGGTFFELPVIVSNYLTDYVALVNAEDIYLADEGGVDIAMSTEASLEMADNPTQDSGAATPVDADLVSMFQTNSVAFRAERTVNWARRRASAVAWMDDITWGDPVEPSEG